MPDQTPDGGGGWKFDEFAIAMIAVGVLGLTLCGGCTFYVAGSALWDLIAHGNRGGLLILFIAAVFGGVPAAGGVALVVTGIDRARRERRPPNSRTSRPPPSAPPPG